MTFPGFYSVLIGIYELNGKHQEFTKWLERLEQFVIQFIKETLETEKNP